MGQVMSVWGNMTEQGLAALFNGSSETIPMLTSLIINGQLMDGKNASALTQTGPSTPTALSTIADEETMTALQASIAKTFFAYSIPQLWNVSYAYPYIIDARHWCDDGDPLDLAKHGVSEDTLKSMSVCYQGNQYYLSAPGYGTPPGMEYLDGKSFGGVTVNDLVVG